MYDQLTSQTIMTPLQARALLWHSLGDGLRYASHSKDLCCPAMLRKLYNTVEEICESSDAYAQKIVDKAASSGLLSSKVKELAPWHAHRQSVIVKSADKSQELNLFAEVEEKLFTFVDDQQKDRCAAYIKAHLEAWIPSLRRNGGSAYLEHGEFICQIYF